MRDRTKQRPNVLWLVSEDNSPEFVEPYGGLARTPTLAALARDGVTYQHAFATAPVCAPCRFSIISGCYATRFAPAHQMRSGDLGVLPDFVRAFPGYLREVGYYCTNNAKQDYNAPIDADDAWDESSTTAHWRDRPDDSPFFAVFNYGATHEQVVHPGVAEPLPDGVRPEDVTLPSYQPDLPELRRDRALYYDQNTIMDRQLAERLAELEADGLAEDTIVFYYGDHGGVLPRSKRFCFDSGLRVPLIVRVPEKWQQLWPHPVGSNVPDLVTLMDLGPTVLALAGLPVPDQMDGRPFAATEGAEPAAYAIGFRNRMDERYDLVRTVRDQRFRLLRNYQPQLPAAQHVAYLFRQPGMRSWQSAYRTGQLDPLQRAFFEPKPYEELYDLTEDPDEVCNLVDSEGHHEVLQRLRDRLDRHLIETRDTGFIPEGSPLERPDLAADPNRYPLPRVLEVAALAAQRDPDQLGGLISSLTDDSEPIRYWAALGCVMIADRLPYDGIDSARTALVRRLTDPSPSVRAAAAEALAVIGPADGPLAILAELVHHDHPRIRLQTVNVLDRLAARGHSDARRVAAGAAKDVDPYVRRVIDHLLSSDATNAAPNHP